MDKENMTPEQRKAERQKALKFQRNVRIAAILLAIVLSIVSLVQSCSTRKAIEDLAAQIAAKKAAQAQEEMLASPSPDASVSAGTSVTLSFIGDVTPASSFSGDGAFESYYNQYGESYFFQNVRSLFEADDLTVASLGCTFTAAELQEEGAAAYRADPAYANILSLGGIDAVSVSNENIMYFGDEGYVDTLAHLDNAGISRFGGDYVTTTTLGQDISLGLTAVNALSDGAGERMESNIQQLKEDGTKIIVALLYLGDQEANDPLVSGTNLAHAAIDAGAHLVVGYGTGELRGIEHYNGRYICYDLGAFLTGNSTSAGDAIVFQQTFQVVNGIVLSDADFTIIPCSTSTDIAANTYCPTPATGTEAERILAEVYEQSAGMEGGIEQETE